MSKATSESGGPPEQPKKSQEQADNRDRAADDPRLASLNDKISGLRNRSRAVRPENRYINRGQNHVLGLAFRISVEVVSALAVGLGIGWLLDQWLDTRPWFMLAFLLMGGCAGMLNVYRVAKGFGYAVGYQDDDAPDEPTKTDDPR